jgi:hypothetical protein
MSKAKEQLAATLINHWFVVDQMLSTGSRKRHPTSKRYSEIAELDYSDKTKVSELIKSFSAFNSKHFIENIRYIIDQRMAGNDTIKVTWSPKILVRGLGGALIIPGLDSGTASYILAAMTFGRQNAEITSALELSSHAVPAQPDGSAIHFMIPGFKNSPYANLSREYSDFAKTFDATLLTAQCLLFVSQNISEKDKSEVLAHRANIEVSTSVTESGTIVPSGISVVETDAVRAQRIAKERLEELRRRRKVTLNSVQVEAESITYRMAPVVAPDDSVALSIGLETLLGW